MMYDKSRIRDPASAPMGSKLIYQDGHGRPCKLVAAFMWTWIGCDRWYYTGENIPPPPKPTKKKKHATGYWSEINIQHSNYLMQMKEKDDD